LAVPLLFSLLLSLLFWLTKVNLQFAAFQDQLRLLFSISGGITLLEAYEAQLSLRDDLATSDLAELTEKLLELLFGRLLVKILDDQVEQVHALLEVVGALLSIQLALGPGLSLTNEQVLLFGVDWLCSTVLLVVLGRRVLSQLRKVVKGLLSVFT